MKLELVPCRMPWGEPAGDGRSGQGKGEGLSSHEGASPGMFTAHTEEFPNTFLYQRRGGSHAHL